MKLIIDTSIFIDHFRGGLAWKKLLKSIKHQEIELYIPTIVLFELYSGQSTKNPDIEEKINKFLKDFTRIELTEKIAKRSGELYRDTTKSLDAPDYIIAASAQLIGGVVVSLNKKHFSQIPNLPLFPL